MVRYGNEATGLTPRGLACFILCCFEQFLAMSPRKLQLSLERFLLSFQHRCSLLHRLNFSHVLLSRLDLVVQLCELRTLRLKLGGQLLNVAACLQSLALTAG